jgi:hypothetical protein
VSTSSWTGGALGPPWTHAIAALGASPELDSGGALERPAEGEEEREKGGMVRGSSE